MMTKRSIKPPNVKGEATRSVVTLLVVFQLLLIQVELPFIPSISAQIHATDVETLGLLWENFDGHNATLWNVRWSPDGTMIVGTFFDDTATIFDSMTGEIIVKLGVHGTGPSSRCWGSKDCTIPEHLPVRSSAWSPDGKYLAIGSDHTVITIYLVSNWSEFKVLEGHKGSVLTLAWVDDGEFLASGSGTDKVEMNNMPENQIRIWNTTTWETVATLKGHLDGVMNLRWSPNGTRLASASDDKSIRIWVRGTWELEKVLLGHTLGVLDVAWSIDGMMLVSGSRDYKIRSWDYGSGEQIERYTEANCVRSVDFHPDGNIYANSGVDEVQLKIRDTEKGSVLKSFIDGAPAKSDIMSSRWSPDGNYLAAGSGKEHALRVYSFGQATDDGGQDDQNLKIGVRLFTFFFVITVAGAVILYPLRRKMREGGL